MRSNLPPCIIHNEMFVMLWRPSDTPGRRWNMFLERIPLPTPDTSPYLSNRELHTVSVVPFEECDVPRSWSPIWSPAKNPEYGIIFVRCQVENRNGYLLLLRADGTVEVVEKTDPNLGEVPNGFESILDILGTSHIATGQTLLRSYFARCREEDPRGQDLGFLYISEGRATNASMLDQAPSVHVESYNAHFSRLGSRGGASVFYMDSCIISGTFMSWYRCEETGSYDLRLVQFE